LIFFPISLSGQFLKGRILDENYDFLEGATIYNSSLKKSIISDSLGRFKISAEKGENKYTISFVGFKPKVLKITFENEDFIETKVVLKSDESLKEVVVSGTLRNISKLNSTVPIKLYKAGYFKANPTASLFEAIENINGIRSQLNCNVCNTGDIRINGQEGANTMILIDGLPIVSGLSTVYGLTGIPQSLIQQVEIIKGPSSTLYGSEAIGGIINLITKVPEKVSPLSIESFSSSWGEVNTDFGIKFLIGQKTNLLAINHFLYQNPIDKNKDGFTDLTLQNRISIFNKLSGKKNDIAFRYFYEDRWGGQTNWSKSERGKDNIYGESIYTHRLEVFGKYRYNDNLFFQYSFNQHNQDSFYGTLSFDAKQTIGFLQAVYDFTINKNLYTLGLSYRYTGYDDNTLATLKKDYTHLPGVFMQTEIIKDNEKSLLIGIRYDYNSNYGNILTPRINFKKSNKEKKSTVRIGLGSGYRIVNVFTEDHAALTGARDVIFKENLSPEKSWSFNLNYVKDYYTKRGQILKVDSSIFKTLFTNRIIPDYDSNPNQIIFSNLDGTVISQGVSVDFLGTMSNVLDFQVGFTFVDTYIKENDIKSIPYLTENFSGSYKLTYYNSFTKSKFDLTGNIVGPMRLPLLSSLDPRPGSSPTFNILNLQATKKVSNFEFFIGVKNLFDFKPPLNSIARAFDPFDKEVSFDNNGNAVVTENNPFGLTFDPTYVFYSNQGRRSFFGLRYLINN
tara:strand:- start:744 stop:2939 length:2196 start_codon:yes stop_codon:yes gene_type:complete